MPELELRTAHLFSMRLAIGNRLATTTPLGRRTFVPVQGGTFEGERLSGIVEDGGNDWLMVGTDDVVRLDCRQVLRTADDHLIGMSYRGYRHGPASVLERLARNEYVEASQYYHRTWVSFETASDQYGWLNKLVAIGSGRRELDGRNVYDVFEVL